MSNEKKHIELRIGYSSRPSYVAVLEGCCPHFEFKRDFNPFLQGREILHDGSRQEVHLLPDASLTFEIEEVRDRKRVRWYAATVQGDAQIHRITRFGALMVARKAMSIREAIRECPEMPHIEVEDE